MIKDDYDPNYDDWREEDDLNDDLDPLNPCEYSEKYDWTDWDWDNDPEWR